MARRSLSPRALSDALRHDRSPPMRRRRWITGLSFLGAGAAMAVGAYQMGLLRRLPDLPLPQFDATRVDASDYAYKRMQTPDGLQMLATYGVTAALAAAGAPDRARRYPWLPLAMAAKTLYDSVTALRLAREEWRDNRALCGYCQTATLASLASAALALPEALAAARHLAGRPAGAAGAGDDAYLYEDGLGLDEYSRAPADAFDRAYPDQETPRPSRHRYRAFAEA